MAIEFPPVRYGGIAAYTFRTSKSGDADRRMSNAATGSLVGDSFIWQPWFVTVGGQLNAQQLTSSTGENNSSSTILSGRFGLGILPKSNFPVNFSYARTDSRIINEDDSIATISDSLNLSGSLRWDQTLNFNTGLSYGTSSQKQSKQNNFGFRFGGSKKFDKHDVDVTTRTNLSDQSGLGADAANQSTLSNILSIHHLYKPWPNVVYDSTSTILISTRKSTAARGEDFTMQTASVLQWTPKEYPITITGAGRTVTHKSTSQVVQSATTAGNTLIEQQSINGRVGATYSYSDRLNFDSSIYGSVEANDSDSTAATGSTPANREKNGSSEMTYGGNIGSTYMGFKKRVLGFNWNWTAGASGAMDGGTNAEKTLSESVFGNQSAYQEFDIPYIGPIDFSLNEGLRINHAKGAPPTGNLTHSASLSHSVGQGASWTVISFSGSENRVISAAKQSTSHLLNLQLTKELRSGISTTWSADITAQMSRQTSSDDKETRSWETYSQGKLGFRTQDVFDLRRLDFNSQIQFAANRLTPLSFETSSIDDEDPVTWTRRFSAGLRYSIGMVSAELKFSLSQNQKKDLTDLLFFTISRRF